jgi:hypothetical protein
MKYLCAIFISLLLASCSKNEVLSSEDQRKVIEDCKSSALETIGEIKSNLVGKWKLAGYACGFCANRENDPESTIEFKQLTGEIYYQDLYIDTILQFNWSIKEGPNLYGEEILKLHTDPPFYVLQFDLFCEDYISFDQGPVDGPMYLFQKK